MHLKSSVRAHKGHNFQQNNKQSQNTGGGYEIQLGA